VAKEEKILYWELWEEGEILFHQETWFIGRSRKYVKEGSENGHLSPYGPCWGIWTGAHLLGTLEAQMEGSGNGVSLSPLSLPPSIQALQGEPEGGGSFTGTLKDM